MSDEMTIKDVIKEFKAQAADQGRHVGDCLDHSHSAAEYAYEWCADYLERHRPELEAKPALRFRDTSTLYSDGRKLYRLIDVDGNETRFGGQPYWTNETEDYCIKFAISLGLTATFEEESDENRIPDNHG